MLKFLISLLIIILFSTPSFAEQALILTELEQMQEKIWYLQRDIAAQKTALKQYQQTIEKRLSDTDNTRETIENQFQSFNQMLNSQQQTTLEVEDELQAVKESLAALSDEFNRQQQAGLQQAEKTGTLESRLRALREDVSTNKQNSEQALAGLQQKLAKTREQLDAVRQQNKGNIDKIAIYLGGAALALAVLLTTGFIFLNSKSGRKNNNRDRRTEHEL